MTEPSREGSLAAPEFAPIDRKMREAGLPAVAVDTFRHYWEQLAEGATGLLPEADIDPVSELPSADDLEVSPDVEAALDKTVVVKLNGGLGTGMGMTGPKSLLVVKDGLTFLDVIARQVLHLREAHGCRLPLVLMNSFRTRDESLKALSRHEGLAGDVPLDFLQHKVPKVLADDLSPAVWPSDPELEWCPPGHGDLYPALVTSGMLTELLDRGYRYAFVSNADNLGAVLDPAILDWFAREEHPFLMEVADRTEADRKGGHLARRRSDGRLVLRESAMCPDGDMDAFQDTGRHRFFNTNSIWIDLQAVAAALDSHGGVLPLPMIRNKKTLDPTDPESPPVFQLETAMGAAISVFEGAQAICVNRRRFAPVKTTNDLLSLWSDAYERTEDERVVLAGGRQAPPFVDLDSAHYKLVGQLVERFPEGAPSLAGCDRLIVRGDATFGRDVVCRGVVEIDAGGKEPLRIPDGATLP